MHMATRAVVIGQTSLSSIPVNHIISRQSCSISSLYSCISCLKQPTNVHTHRVWYSSRTAKAAVKAYHKAGINGFVYNLSEEEREELLQTLSKASKSKESSQQVIEPTTSQLRYGKLSNHSHVSSNCYLLHACSKLCSG